jgi:hypothetical protein
MQEENETDFFAKLQSAPDADASEIFPEWLLNEINHIETAYSKDSVIISIQIFRGEWKNQIIYYIRNDLMSCMLCDVYYENGEKVVWPKNGADNFCITSKNWKRLYTYGKASSDPDMVIEDRSGTLYYSNGLEMWAVRYAYPGTIDSVDDYLMPNFKNEKNFPIDIWPGPKVRISGSCYRTNDLFPLPAGYTAYYIDLTDFIYE